LNGAGEKILIIAPSWVGDAVLSQPLLALLRAKHPAARIDVLAPAWVLPVYRRMPQVADTIASPFRHGELAITARLRLAGAIRQARYDQAFILPNSFKSALVPWLAGIARRTGFVGELRYGLLTDPRPLDEEGLPRMVQRFAHLAVGRNEPLPQPLPRPALRVSALEAEAVLAAKGLARPARLACFCPGAEYGPAKRWPARYFAQLAQLLAREGYTVWLLGSNKDAAIGAEIAQQAAGAARDLTGKTSLDEAIVLLSIADQVVTNDSGLMHVAAALDRPLVAIYGSSSPEFTPPLSDRARIARLGIACSPCFERVCPLGHFDCMMRLEPERIAREIRSVSAGA
jgi:heptosyltransferase-2